MYQPSPTGVPVDPIISRLRPRTVAEVLDHAFRLYRKNFVTFISILAVVHIPIQLITVASTLFFVGDLGRIQEEASSGSFSTRNTSGLFAFLGAFYVVVLGVALLGGLVQKLSEGALTAGVADSHLDKPVTFGTAYRQMLQRIGPLLGLILLQTLITFAVFIPFILLILFGIGFSFSDNTAGAGGGLICFGCILMPLALIGLLYLTIRLTVTTPSLIIEKLGPVEAIRRSWGLIQNFWWRTLALQAILFILGYIVQIGPGALVSGLVSAFAPRDFVLQQVASGFVTTFTTLLFLPIQLISITLYYFDLRVRKEGYDLETALSQRYAAPPNPAYGGAYGGGYDSAYGSGYSGYGQYGETQPTGGSGYNQPANAYGQTQPTNYGPPQLGAAEPQSPYSAYGSYLPGDLQSGQAETPEPTTSDDSPPETPRQPQPDSPEQS